MQPHAHITLCDEKWAIYYDYIDFNIINSVSKFVDFIFEIFSSKKISKDKIESYMYQCVDENNAVPLYFKTGNLIYLWVICTGCRASSLN